jgi:hypothetical protein
MKAPTDREDRLVDESTDNQVQKVGTQSAECGDISQSAEINNSVTDESTNTNIVNEGDPVPDICS